MDLRCVLPPLDMPGCFGRRNCNVNLDDLRWDRPDLDCEPQQARDIPAIFNWTRQGWLSVTELVGEFRN